MKFDLEINEVGESSSDDEEDEEVAQGKDGATMDYLFEPDGLKGRRLSAFWKRSIDDHSINHKYFNLQYRLCIHIIIMLILYARTCV